MISAEQQDITPEALITQMNTEHHRILKNFSSILIIFTLPIPLKISN